MLAIQYPWRYASVFEPFCDFYVCEGKEELFRGTTLKPTKSTWIDVSRSSIGSLNSISQCIPKEYEHHIEGIILPAFDEPGQHLLNQVRMKVPHMLNIGLWVGNRQHLSLIKQAVDVVALPWWKHRNLVITSEEAHAYHAYEFSNLDELRRYPYRSLHSSVPITAAYMGIDLTDRERRPKRLPPFTYNMVLTEAQLELAYKNCQAIKEAMEYARRNNTLHT